MKILVLNGSPKKEKSDVMHLTRAFLEGMNEISPQEITTVHLIEKHIEYCRGCFTCMHNGGACVIDDEMRALLQQVRQSDVLLFSFPLYCYGMPAPLKAFADRMLPLSSMAMHKVGERYEHVGQADCGRLRCVMICGCGFPNSKHNFEPAAAQFRLMFPDDPTVITVPESPMFNAPEAAGVTGPRLALLRQAGRQFAGTGAVSPELIEEIKTPMIPEEVYAAIVNTGV